MSAKLKELLLRLIKSHHTPREIAFGVAVGVFISILPLYGLHTILVIAAACLIRRTNKIAILIGTNFSLPPTLPFITWAGYETGRLVLGGDYPYLSWQVFKSLARMIYESVFKHKSIFKFMKAYPGFIILYS